MERTSNQEDLASSDPDQPNQVDQPDQDNQDKNLPLVEKLGPVTTGLKMLLGLKSIMRTALTGEKPPADYGERYFNSSLKQIIEGKASSNYGVAGGYEAWDNQEYWQPVINSIKEYLQQQLEANPQKTEFKILDIGTAFGYLLKYLKPLEDELDINLVRVGADISRYALEHADEEQGSAGASLVEQDLEEGLPLAAESLDIVAAADVVEHTKSRQFTFDEISRVLKPGGFLAVSIPITDTFLGKLLWNRLDVDPTHISIGNSDEVKEELEQAGFKVLSEGGFFGAGHFRLPFATNLELTAILEQQ